MTTINRITEQDVLDFDISRSLNDYQRIATKSAIYPGVGTIFGLSYCAHKLAGEAGEFNEHFGKAMRDDGIFDARISHYEHSNEIKDHYRIESSHYNVRVQPLTDARRAFLIKEIGDCLWYISALCNELGITLFQAAYMNLVKLHDRTERGRLQGGGDDR